MPTENERKWLMPDDLPADMSDHNEMVNIRQAYLTRPERPLEVRAREARRVREGSISHTLTIKSAGSADDRMEIPRPITFEEFEDIWERRPHCRLEKTRFEYSMAPLGLSGQPDVTLEVDVFSTLDLVIGEIEFDDLEQLKAYDPPLWFGEEVTGAEAYRNAVIATHAPVPEEEIPNE